jgi:hypothetical protein
MKKIQKIWLKWQKITEKAINFQIKIILIIFYWTIILVYAILVKIFSDPLDIKNKKPQWLVKKIEKPNLNEAGKQY